MSRSRQPPVAQYPSETESARRNRNGARFNYRTTTEIRAKLDEMTGEDHVSVGDFLDMLVEGEWESRQEARRKTERKARAGRKAAGFSR